MLDNLAAPQEAEHARAQSVSLAFLLTLERLSPAERAVFILHDLFDTPFGEIAMLLHKSEAACRQMALRARAHVSDAKPRQTVTDPESARLTQAFLVASQTGDEAELRTLLAEDAVVHTDGGGIRPAVFNLILGGAKAARMDELPTVNTPRVLEPCQPYWLSGGSGEATSLRPAAERQEPDLVL